jgi:hypothetical protein
MDLQSAVTTSAHSAPEQREFPRGVSPLILLEQVRNTIPFLFERTWDAQQHPHLALLTTIDPKTSPSHTEYFRLCLAAHHATVASFVPTDVDNQIRFKLWHPALPVSDVLEMARIVEESLNWDCRVVSTRYVLSPRTGKILTGHLGEWFSTAAAAYGALRRKDARRAAEIYSLILEQVRGMAEVYQDLKKSRDRIGALKASTLIAHNLGDLDRVIDMWNLPQDDPLREKAYKLGHEESRATRDSQFATLEEAGRLNKACMADENHRHFALRAPRCLRKSPDFLLPVGPFFDDWGKIIGRHPGLCPEDVAEVVEALIAGWEKLSGTVGYPRALAGILTTFPGSLNRLTEYLPARVARTLRSGELRALCARSQRQFEEQWAAKVRF